MRKLLTFLLLSVICFGARATIISGIHYGYYMDVLPVNGEWESFNKSHVKFDAYAPGKGKKSGTVNMKTTSSSDSYYEDLRSLINEIETKGSMIADTTQPGCDERGIVKGTDYYWAVLIYKVEDIDEIYIHY